MSRVVPADAASTAQLLAVEERRRRALIEVDLVVLEALFDPTLVHIHAPGVTMNKAELLEHTATRRVYLAIERGELEVRLIGDVAIMTGPITNRLRTAEGGERTLRGVATQVLHLGEDGQWRFLSFQMTPYGDQAWGALPSQQRVGSGTEGGQQ